MRTIRQAIPFEEIEANMKNQPRSTRSSRYGRTPTYISEMEADARVAIVGLTFGGIAIIAIGLALWVAYHSISTAQAHEAPIVAKSDLAPAQLKTLNVMQVRSEKHAKG